MHPKIEPNNKIFLHQALAIEELVEIDQWIPDVLFVVRIRRLRLRVLLPGDGHVEGEGIDEISKVAGLVVCEMRSAIRRQDPVAAIFTEFVAFVSVHDTILSGTIPDQAAVVF